MANKELAKVTTGEIIGIIKALAEKGYERNTYAILGFLRDMFGLSKDYDPIAMLVEEIVLEVQ